MNPTNDNIARNTGEFELIDRLRAILGNPSEGSIAPSGEVVVGNGDDCAAVRRGDFIDVYTTDTMVDGIHFKSSEIIATDLGWKAMAVNLSDIAAMGAMPSHSLVTLGLPRGVSDRFLEGVYDGIASITSKFGGAVIGGDIISAPELFISVTAIGYVESHDRAGSDLTGGLLVRSGAQPGDTVAVTGSVGGSAAGLMSVERKIGGSEADRLRDKHFRPIPRIEEGRALVACGVRCAIDISDGLVADLGHICEESGTSAVIELANVPLMDESTRLFPEESHLLGLTGGEDYELLFTAPLEVVKNAQAALAAVGTPVTVIGAIRGADASSTAVTVLDESGETVSITRPGWDHLT
jgi:thiamine-monophosphate kinase